MNSALTAVAIPAYLAGTWKAGPVHSGIAVTRQVPLAVEVNGFGPACGAASGPAFSRQRRSAGATSAPASASRWTAVASRSAARCRCLEIEAVLQK